MARRIHALLVAGGRSHDFDFVRLELLRRTGTNPAVHTTVRPDFSDIDALSSADLSVDGVATATTGWASFFELLGTKFIAHPAIRQFDVRAPEGVSHPFLADIRNFRTNDEIYLLERTADIDVLLETTYVGATTGVPAHWDDETPQPVLYVRRLGSGSIVYLTLGHASERRDTQPTNDADLAAVERCSWEVPEFLEIRERAFEWAWSE